MRAPISSRRGITLIEIIVGIGIVTILIVAVISSVSHFRERTEGVRCAGNIKSLQVSLGTYVHDVGHWPQEPQELWAANDSDAYEDWWIAEMKPYGATEQVWRCPTIVRKVSKHKKDGRPKMHYTPTMFDEKPYTPYKWTTQPWLVEVGNMHGRGALVGFPDGSVKAMDDLVPR